jgi:hypothetical protein
MRRILFFCFELLRIFGRKLFKTKILHDVFAWREKFLLAQLAADTRVFFLYYNSNPNFRVTRKFITVSSRIQKTHRSPSNLAPKTKFASRENIIFVDLLFFLAFFRIPAYFFALREKFKGVNTKIRVTRILCKYVFPRVMWCSWYDFKILSQIRITANRYW